MILRDETAACWNVHAVIGLAFVMAMTACGARGSSGSADPIRAAEQLSGSPAPDARQAGLYRRAGMIAAGGALPFTGTVRYFAGPTPDSTLALFSLSLANRSLTFSVEGNQYRAAYRVETELRRAGGSPERVDARQVVRVQAYRETSRTEESIVFQQFVMLAPGEATATVTVRDEGSQRAGTTDVRLEIPRLDGGDLSSPAIVYDATPRVGRDSALEVIANPRATVVFGRDSVLPVYVEGYGLTIPSVVLIAATETGREVWRDTVALPPRSGMASGVLSLSVSQIGAGALTLMASPVGGSDTTRTPLFVSFGEEWAITSYEEMLDFLRFFATADELAELRNAEPGERAVAWESFWKATDPVPTTAENEALRDYFARVRIANERFGEEGGPGWLTDRGRVLLTLGDPDQVYEQSEMSLRQRGRAQVWVYNQYQVQLVFVDQSGFGRWRLTMASEADLASAARRRRR